MRGVFFFVERAGVFFPFVALYGGSDHQRIEWDAPALRGHVPLRVRGRLFSRATGR
jgi:hypothetical protein